MTEIFFLGKAAKTIANDNLVNSPGISYFYFHSFPQTWLLRPCLYSE